MTELRRLRIASGLTARAVAKYAGITDSYMSHLEYGRSVPSIATAEVIAQCIGVDREDIWETRYTPHLIVRKVK
jgi:transcriptional regulator with XRE-family HTH domain